MKITEEELRKIIKEETKEVMEESDVLQEIIPSWAAMQAKGKSIDPRLFNKRSEAAELLEIYEGKFVDTAGAYAKKMGDLSTKLTRDLERAKVDELAEVKDIDNTMKEMVEIAQQIGLGTKGKFKASIDALRAEGKPAPEPDLDGEGTFGTRPGKRDTY